MVLKDLENFYRITFATNEGQEVLADLESAYYHRISYGKDPYETAYKEGQRSVILRINNLIKEKKQDGRTDHNGS